MTGINRISASSAGDKLAVGPFFFLNLVPFWRKRKNYVTSPCFIMNIQLNFPLRKINRNIVYDVSYISYKDRKSESARRTQNLEKILNQLNQKTAINESLIKTLLALLNTLVPHGFL